MNGWTLHVRKKRKQTLFDKAPGALILMGSLQNSESNAHVNLADGPAPIVKQIHHFLYWQHWGLN
jgi:hypothetical protein